MKDPLVTVLMSVYNGEKYLAEAIESILGQTYHDFEFIIINDGSTDISAKIISSYSDPRIRLIKNETNIGLTRSLNKGIALARGKYIARMDADDISLPERLEKQVGFMETNEDIAVCGASLILINTKQTVLQMQTDFEKLFSNIFFGNQLAHSSVLMRKAVVLSVGNYNENYYYAQDYELWFRMLKNNYKIVNMHEVLHQYRMISSNISQKFNLKQEHYAAMAAQYGFHSILNIKLSLQDVLFLRKVIGNSTIIENYLLSRLRLYCLVFKIKIKIRKVVLCGNQRIIAGQILDALTNKVKPT